MSGIVIVHNRTAYSSQDQRPDTDDKVMKVLPHNDPESVLCDAGGARLRGWSMTYIADLRVVVDWQITWKPKNPATRGPPNFVIWGLSIFAVSYGFWQVSSRRTCISYMLV